MNEKFNFVMPAEIQKSEEGEWKVAGLASTQDLDQQGELIVQEGIDLTPIDNKRGYFNFDHQKGPENMIGTIDGYSRGDKGLYVHGKLFKNHDRAKAIYSIMSSLGKSDRGRVGLSVEGQILERDAKNKSVIKKCRIDKVAVTLNPVNQKTYADLLKSMSKDTEIEFNATKENSENDNNEDNTKEALFTATQVISMVEKALAITQNYGSTPPNELTDGSAMATSSMAPKKKKDKKDKDKEDLNITGPAKVHKSMSKELYKSMMLKMLDKIQKIHPDCSRLDLFEAIKDRLETRFPNVYSAEEEQ